MVNPGSSRAFDLGSNMSLRACQVASEGIRDKVGELLTARTQAVMRLAGPSGPRPPVSWARRTGDRHVPFSEEHSHVLEAAYQAGRPQIRLLAGLSHLAVDLRAGTCKLGGSSHERLARETGPRPSWQACLIPPGSAAGTVPRWTPFPAEAAAVLEAAASTDADRVTIDWEGLSAAFAVDLRGSSAQWGSNSCSIRCVRRKARPPLPPTVVTIDRSRRDDGLSVGVAISFHRPPGAPATMRINGICLLYTSPSPRDKRQSRMPSSA